jgi:hypothetical protein
MPYTLGQAAKATGKTKPTIAHAIKTGRISATRTDTGEWSIDPAELHRVYPPLPGKSSPVSDAVKPQLQEEAIRELIELRSQNKALETELRVKDDLLRQVEGERDNLREQNTRITALLAAPKPDRFAELEEKLAATLARFEAEEPPPPPVKSIAEEKANRGIIARLFRRSA